MSDEQTFSTERGPTSEGQFRLAFRYRFESAHRFTQSCEDSCATPHGHTWYAEAAFAASADGLGEDDMVMEFSKLKKSWKTFILETVDHSFMHHHADPILGALKEYIPRFRGLPFPGDPTTELIAALFFAKLQTMHENLRSGNAASAIWPAPVSVLIQETPTNQVLFQAGTAGNALLAKINSKFEGWWQVADPLARDLRPR